MHMPIQPLPTVKTPQSEYDKERLTFARKARELKLRRRAAYRRILSRAFGLRRVLRACKQLLHRVRTRKALEERHI